MAAAHPRDRPAAVARRRPGAHPTAQPSRLAWWNATPPEPAANTVVPGRARSGRPVRGQTAACRQLLAAERPLRRPWGGVSSNGGRAARAWGARGTLALHWLAAQVGGGQSGAGAGRLGRVDPPPSPPSPPQLIILEGGFAPRPAAGGTGAGTCPMAGPAQRPGRRFQRGEAPSMTSPCRQCERRRGGGEKSGPSRRPRPTG